MPGKPYECTDADRAAIVAAIDNMPPIPPGALAELADALQTLYATIERERIATALRQDQP